MTDAVNIKSAFQNVRTDKTGVTYQFGFGLWVILRKLRHDLYYAQGQKRNLVVGLTTSTTCGLVSSSLFQDPRHTETTLPRFYPDYGLTTGDSRYIEWGGNVGDRSNLPFTKKVPHMVGCVRAEP